MENRKERTRERVRKHRRIQSALANVASCSHVSHESDVTYEMDSISGEIASKIARYYDSGSSNDINESTVEYQDIDTNTIRDDNYNSSEDQNNTNISTVDKSQNESEIELLRKWAITCNIPIADLDKLLGILRKRLLPQLPKSGTTFSNTCKTTYNIQIMKGVQDCIGEYVYLGIENGLNGCVDPKIHDSDNILLQINIDGASPYHSSTKQLWPILCKVLFNPDIYSPFPVALYYGDTKPGNINEYLNDFIEEVNALQESRVYIDEKRYNVQLHHIICDIPARFVKQIKGHGGYAACERCEVIGTCVGFPKKRVVYPDTDSRLRSDTSFREQRQKDHHVNISPLQHIQPPLDLVHSFPIDYMHMCCLGIVKRFYVMDLLFKKTAVRLKSTLSHKLSERMTLIKPFVPEEFPRKPRPFVPNLKASELRLIVLYAGPIIFKGILRSDIYDHFLLLHTALRILCTKHLAQQFNDTARSYLKTYFLCLPKLFGQGSHVLNAHYLLHLADDVRLNYTLNDLSAFPFENQLWMIKTLLRTANRPLAQLCRRIHERSNILQKAVIPPRFIIIRQKICPNNRNLLVKLKYDQFSLTTKQPNNIVMLQNDMIIKIENLGYVCVSEDDVKIIGVRWLTKKPIFQYSTSSADLHMWQLQKQPSKDVITFKLTDIKFKMVLMRLPYERDNVRRETVFAISLLHT